MSNVAERMQELMQPIEVQIMLCQGREEELMIACAMLTVARDLLLKNIGPTGMSEIMIDSIMRATDDKQD